MNFCISLIELVKNSKKFVTLIVFIVCLVVSAYQLSECLKKLQKPPVSTHYRFAINETLNYPAVTICRNPPYKAGVLKYYNIGLQTSSVEHTSEWQYFPFDRATLQQVWDNATYSKEEVIKLYGLHGDSANAEIVQRYYFYHGRCFSFIPRVGATQPWPNSGWSILLQHVDKNYNNVVNKPQRIGQANMSEKDGFHVYVHEVREPWTENLAQTKYIMNYLYLEVGEELEVKVNTDEFRGISTSRRPCSTDINYSQYQCIEQRWWNNISQEAGCTVPWMRGVVNLPHCSKYDPLLKLLYSYTNLSDISDSSCACHPCSISVYKLQVVKRQQLRKPFSQLHVYYTGKGVTCMTELPGYDANAFLADLGGSLGFFLGLSVVGALGALEKLVRVVGRLARSRDKQGEEQQEEEQQEKA